MSAHTAEKKGTFLEEVIEATPGGERLVHCLQCGSCGGSCPSGADMEYTPRTLIAMINAGDRDAVLAANTMWACVSCYFCTTRCPQNIPITDIIYALKRMSIAEQRYQAPTPRRWPRRSPTSSRSMGGATRPDWPPHYHLLKRWKPLQMMKMGPMGMKIFARGRMAIRPTKIRQIDQLQAIIEQSAKKHRAKLVVGHCDFGEFSKILKSCQSASFSPDL